MTIDMHAHWSPPELMDIYRARTESPMIHTNETGEEVIKTRRGEQSFDGMFDDLETRLAEMDAHGVTTGVLSLWGRISGSSACRSLNPCRRYRCSIMRHPLCALTTRVALSPMALCR